MKRTSQEIKKEILKILSNIKSLSYSELERKVNTGYKTIVSNCQELQSFDSVKITKLKDHVSNGKEYSLIKITEQGRKFLKNLN